LNGVEAPEKGGVAPCEIEAEVIVGDVDSPDIPVFILEEVENIKEVEEVDENHGIGDISEGLMLVYHPREVDESPCDDTGASVIEKFEDLLSTNPRIQLDAHVIVIDQGAGEHTVVGMGGCDIGFDVDGEGQEKTVGVDSEKKAFPMASNYGGIDGSEHRASCKEYVGDSPSQ
jgi:hypothetical protein